MMTIPEPRQDEVIQALLLMRSKIAKGWCNDALARDADGKLCSVYEHNACVWSLNGALVCTKIYSTTITDALASAVNKRLPSSVFEKIPFVHYRLTVWNDTVAKNQQEVLEVIDEAIDWVSRKGSCN